jgi:hypothetical protein
MMNWNGFGRKQSLPNKSIIPEFTGGTEEKTTKSTIRISRSKFKPMTSQIKV